MRTSRIITLVLLAALLVTATLFTNTQAQAQAKKVVCDADVILSLYTAESYFNLDAFLVKLAVSPAGKDIPVVDISKLEKGQYEPLFAALSKSTKPKDAILNDKGIDAIVQLLAVPSSTSAMMDASGTLKPALITGEAAECSILRAQLNFFYTIVASQSAAPATTPAK